MSLDDKLFKVKFDSDEISHLKADNEICKKCKDKPCQIVCPANVWEWDECQNKININYENCLECGACRIACPFENVSWQYPQGNKGVTFKHG